ncbi:threonine ammonia-lyase IlvA [Georgenia sp. Z1344]|uniref:threonine ammonia-lyase IlvA n=1 Tax=Georgenia sp. Z1344 TaxID=3416706 RepID=UPI003CE9E3A4
MDVPNATAVSRAAHLLRPVVRRTPLETNPRLSEAVDHRVLLKREDLQLTRSYKVRGAYTVMAGLTEEQRAAGVVCASAGNHAQGVALACARLSIHGTVVLPGTTPRQKRARIAEIGGSWVTTVVVDGPFEDADARARELVTEQGLTYVHPFDHPLTISGQGSVGVEIAEQSADRGERPGVVVVPVGGGGLLAGVALALKNRVPGVRIVGVEPEGAASMQAALAAGGPVRLPEVDAFVDGAAVARAGQVGFDIARDLVDDIISVPTGAVCTEMLAMYQTDGIIAEPAGALATAAVANGLVEVGDAGPVVCIVSGGNNDVSRYAEIVERSAIHEGLRHYFLVTFPQEPGALRSFLEETLTGDEDIIHFEYTKKNNRETGPALVGIDLARASDRAGLEDRMERSHMRIERLTLGSGVLGMLL